MTEGGLTFTIEFDYDKRIAKTLNQEISLAETNVVLVDFVDSTNGPTIVGSRWVGPALPDQPPSADEIAAPSSSTMLKRRLRQACVTTQFWENLPAGFKRRLVRIWVLQRFNHQRRSVLDSDPPDGTRRMW